MVIFQTFRSGRIVARTFQRNLPYVWTVADSVICIYPNGRTLGSLTKALEYTGLYAVLDFAGFAVCIIGGNHWSNSLNEFLIAVGLMESRELDTALRFIFIVPLQNFRIVLFFNC